MKFLNSKLIVLSLNGIVVNNGFDYTQNTTYYIWNTSITNFSIDLWESLQKNDMEKPFRITSSTGIKYIASTNIIYGANTTVI